MELIHIIQFVERTQKILEQYKNIQLPVDEKHEVVLLLNACVGLLFIGRQKYSNRIKKDKLEVHGLNSSCVSLCKDNQRKDEDINMQTVSRHVRNSIAHCRFDFVNKGGYIKGIKLYDKVKETDKDLTFEMEMNISDFQSYVLTISDFILRKK